MLFTHPVFLFFFLIVFLVYWGTPSHRIRKGWLLAASYFFYAYWDWRFCFLIAASTLIDFSIGMILRNPKPWRGRKFWLIVSMVANLGFLGFFKYFNFFIESANSIGNYFGLSAGGTLEIVLPVGISFYTFQTMSYTIDIYRGKLKPITNFVDFALFVSFFPQLVAGPIVRAREFLPQLTTKKMFADVPFKSAFLLFFLGFIKKACISDNIAALIDPVFVAPAGYDAASLWMSTLFYAAQIYCDFSGYTDMAIACAALLGFKLPLNFSFPYLATNIRLFWQRWHISLSTWLRDYLYIPLGGNRGGESATLRNLMITMLLGGLWHGAGWNFVVWGGLHGFALIVHRKWSQWRGDAASPAIFNLFGVILTFYWVCLAWIFFRTGSMGDAWIMLKAYVFFISPGERALDIRLFLWFVPMVIAHWIAMRVDLTERIKVVPDWLFSAGLGVAVAIALLFVRIEYTPFIYFQF